MAGTALTLFPVAVDCVVPDRGHARADEPPPGHVVPDERAAARNGTLCTGGSPTRAPRTATSRAGSTTACCRPACRWARSADAAAAASRSVRSTSRGRWPTRPATRAGWSTRRPEERRTPTRRTRPTSRTTRRTRRRRRPASTGSTSTTATSRRRRRSATSWRTAGRRGSRSYHYGRLLDNDRLNPTTVGVDYPWWKDLVWEEIRKWPPIPEPDPPFDLIGAAGVPAVTSPGRHLADRQGRTRQGRRGACTSPARRPTPGSPGRSRRPSPRACATRAARSSPRAPCCASTRPRRRAAADGHDKEPKTYLAQAFVPDVAPGAALEIADGDEVVWRREAPDEPPTVEVNGRQGRPPRERDGVVGVVGRRGRVLAALVARRRGVASRSMTGLEPTEGPDPGRTAAARRRPACRSSPTTGSSRASRALRVTVPDRAPEAVILHPVDGHTYTAGQSVRLWASLADARTTWPTRRSGWSTARRSPADSTPG